MKTRGGAEEWETPWSQGIEAPMVPGGVGEAYADPAWGNKEPPKEDLRRLGGGGGVTSPAVHGLDRSRQL